DTDTGLPLTAPVICWEGVVDITADQANAATRGSKAVPPDPKEFLLTILTNGSVLQSKIIERGQQCGFSEDQFQRAKEKPAIKASKTGGAGSPWMLALPEDVAEGTEPKKEDCPMRSVYEVRDGFVQHVGLAPTDADGWYISKGDAEPLGW